MRTSALSSLLLLFAAPAAADPDLVSVSWGRLADVYAPQSGGASQLLARDLLIGPRVPAGIVPTQGEVSRLVRVHLSQPTVTEERSMFSFSISRASSFPVLRK